MKSLYFENNLTRLLALKAASFVSKNAAFGRFSPVQYGDIPEPEIPNPRWLKIKNISCGLCGTDIHFLFMDMDPKCFPAAIPGIRRKHLGHELVGEVIEIGSDVKGLSIHDRVALRVDWPSCFQMEIDPPCPQCRSGNYMLCENLGKKDPLVIDNGGGFSPMMVMHHSQPFKIPETIDNAKAVLLEPLACAFHTVMKHPPQENEQVLVIGGGTIGLLTLAVASSIAPDAKLVCLARYPFQADIAKKLGADDVVMDSLDIYRTMSKVSGGGYFKGYFGNEILLGGFHVIYDTVGSDASVSNALRWVKGKGAVVLSGINFKPKKLDYSVVWNQEVNFTGINCHATEATGQTSFEMAAAFLEKTDLPLTDLITHRFPMENYKEAVQTFLSKKNSHAIKIVLEH